MRLGVSQLKIFTKAFLICFLERIVYLPPSSRACLTVRFPEVRNRNQTESGLGRLGFGWGRNHKLQLSGTKEACGSWANGFFCRRSILKSFEILFRFVTL